MKQDMTLEQELLQVVTDQLKASIHKMDMIQLPYNKRFELPQDFMQQAWGLIDKDELLKSLSERLRAELVDRLVNAFAAEIATDIKQVLSVKERREAIRALVRDNIDSLVG